MREFVDAILTAIGAASLNDDEFAMITIETQAYTKALYTEVLLVLDSREAVSDIRNRLGHYFQARGVEIGEPPSPGKSNIYLGDDLCS